MGFDDAGSLNTFATGTFQLTQTIGTFIDNNFQTNEEEVVDSIELPVDSIPNSTTGAASNISEITSESSPGSPTGSVSVASAPADLGYWSSSPTNSSRSLSGDELSHTAIAAASLRKTGVTSSND